MPAKKKINKDRQLDKSREFVFILYPENPDFHITLLMIKSFKYECVAIKHDKDTYAEDVVDEETGELLHSAGELKKEHYHVYIRFPNPRKISGVSDELNIEEHLIQFCDSYKAYVEYMLHWGKHGGVGHYTYDLNDLFGSLSSNAKSFMLHEPSELKIDKIADYIFSQSNFVDYYNVYCWCRDKGYSGICTSRMNVIKEFIYCHNERIARMRAGGRI